MAFAAVISLGHTIERLITPTNPEIAESAYEELLSLRYTLKRLDHRNYRSIDRSAINIFDAEIRVAVYKLEDLLQSYALNLAPLEEINGVEQEIDLILTRLQKLRSKYNRELDNPLPREEDEVVSPINVSSPKKSTTVGLSGQLELIRNQLLDGTHGLKTISFVGMAGIGKTHLALEVYQDPLIVQEFEFRVRVSVGQKDLLSKVLVDIVAQIQGKPINSP